MISLKWLILVTANIWSLQINHRINWTDHKPRNYIEERIIGQFCTKLGILKERFIATIGSPATLYLLVPGGISRYFFNQKSKEMATGYHL